MYCRTMWVWSLTSAIIGCSLSNAGKIDWSTKMSDIKFSLNITSQINTHLNQCETQQ